MTDLISADWRELDSDNTSPSPNGVQGGYSPSQIAPVIRAVRGSLKRFYNQSNAIYTSTGTAAAYVLTFQSAPSGYSKGIVYRFWAHITNTGAATLNINTLGARAIVSPVDGTALTAGQIVSGKMVEVIYNGTAFELLSDMGQNSKLTGNITITGNTVQTGTSTQTGNSSLAGLLTINRTGEALRISSGDATSDPFVSFFKTIDTTDTRQGYLQHADGTTIGTTGLIIHNDVSNMRVVLDNVSGTSGLTFRVGSSNYNVWNTGNLPLPANSNVQMIAGNGITGGGTLAADRTLTLGTPSDITYTSNNTVTATSHTHNLVITAANLNTIYGFTPANTTSVTSLSANVTSISNRVSLLESPGVAILEDQKPSGTSGGASTPFNTWTVHTLNTEVSDPANFVSLASNSFTVAENCTCDFDAVFYATANARTRIFNVTDNVQVAASSNLQSPNSSQSPARGYCYLTAGKTYRLEWYSAGGGSTGLGNPQSITGVPETYARVILTKV